MGALTRKMDFRRSADPARRLRRAARIGAHVLGWPILVKTGLLTGFAVAAAARHLVGGG
jgi:hypothetical protein